MASTGAPSRPGRVFISYRRDDTQHVAGRLADRLAQRFGGANVFMDVDSIEPGVDFASAIDTAVAGCNVLVALIGRQWLSAADSQGRRRLEDPNDFVVLEIRAALARDVRVIPVLVDGASMPRSDDLPSALRPLVRRNAVRLDHETFRLHAAELLDTIDRVLHVSPGSTATATPGAAAGAFPPPSLERDRSGDTQADAASAHPDGEPDAVPDTSRREAAAGHSGDRSRGERARRKRPLLALAAAVVVLASAATLLMIRRQPGAADVVDPTSSTLSPTPTGAPEGNDQQRFCDRSRSADATTDEANLLLLTPVPQDQSTAEFVRDGAEQLYKEGAAEMAAVVEAAPADIASAAEGVRQDANDFVQLLDEHDWSLAAVGRLLLAAPTLQQDRDARDFEAYLAQHCNIGWNEISQTITLSTAAKGLTVLFGAALGLEVTSTEADCSVDPLTSGIDGDVLLEVVGKNVDPEGPVAAVVARAVESCIAEEPLGPALASLLSAGGQLSPQHGECVAEGILSRVTLAVVMSEDEVSPETRDVLTQLASDCQAPLDIVLALVDPTPAAELSPVGLGNDGQLDDLATDCYIGLMDACDDLYNQSESGSDYEHYGDTCGGRQPEGTNVLCAIAFPEP